MARDIKLEVRQKNLLGIEQFLWSFVVVPLAWPLIDEASNAITLLLGK